MMPLTIPRQARVWLPVLALTAAAAVPADACTRVFWNTNKQAKVVARTMDLYRPDGAKLVFYPRGVERDGHTGANTVRWTSRHASMAVTVLDASTADGMNEHGLAAHMLYMSDTKYEPRDGRPGVTNLLWAQYLLDTCATVREVLAALDQFQVVSAPTGGRDWPVHLAVEDASGDSAVVEFVGGKRVVHHGREFTVMTNEPSLDAQLKNLARYKPFGGTLPLPGDIDPLSRFVRASTYLKTLPEPADGRDAMAGNLSVVRSTMVPFGGQDTGESGAQDAWPTLWTTAANLTDRVFLFQSTKSPNLFWVDLKNLSPTGPTLVLDPYDPALSGEASKAFKAARP